MRKNDLKLVKQYLSEGKCQEALEILSIYLERDEAIAHFYTLSVFSGVYNKDFRNKDEYLKYLEYLYDTQDSGGDSEIGILLIQLLSRMMVGNKDDELIKTTIELMPHWVAARIEQECVGKYKIIDSIICSGEWSPPDVTNNECLEVYIASAEQYLNEGLYNKALSTLKESRSFIFDEKDKQIKKKWLSLCDEAYLHTLTDEQRNSLQLFVEDFESVYCTYFVNENTIPSPDSPKNAAILYCLGQGFIQPEDKELVNNMFLWLIHYFFEYEWGFSYYCLFLLKNYFDKNF